MRQTKSNITLMNANELWFFDADINKSHDGKEDTYEVESVYNFRRNGVKIDDDRVPQDIINKAFALKFWLMR